MKTTATLILVGGVLVLAIVAGRHWWQQAPAPPSHSAATAATAMAGNAQATEPAPAAPAEGDSAEPAAYDAVIVGAGISGLSAALELGRRDMRVTVIDMAAVFGGHARAGVRGQWAPA